MLYHDILLFLHLLGLTLGLGVGITNMVIARVAASAATPEGAGALRGLPPMLARISMAGLGILVVTGLLLIGQRGFDYMTGGMKFAFWLKMAGVAGMGAIAYLMFQAQTKIRQGDMAAAAQLRMLGPAMGGLSLLVVLLAIFAFH